MMALRKEDRPRLFWTAFGAIYIGGIVLYFMGVKPQNALASDIIPVDEPSAIDWVEVGGILFLT